MFKDARFVRPALLSLLVATSAGAQSAQMSLRVGGDIPRPFTVTVDEVRKMPHTSVTVSEQGVSVRYDGVPASELLKRGGAPLGREHGGPALATSVIVVGRDGYRALFALAELDSDLTAV